MSVRVQLNNGTVLRRHQDHIRNRSNEVVRQQASSDIPEVVLVVLPESDTAPPITDVSEQPDIPKSPLATTVETPVEANSQRTRPVWNRARPGYLKDYICEL